MGGGSAHPGVGVCQAFGECLHSWCADADQCFGSFPANVGIFTAERRCQQGDYCRPAFGVRSCGFMRVSAAKDEP
jgi:hypothetical protein